MNDEILKNVLNAEVARTLLTNISQEAKDALILDALTKQINDFNFKSVVTDAFKKEAAEMAERLVKEPEFQQAMELAIRESFEKLIKQLPDAVYSTMVGALTKGDKYHPLSAKLFLHEG